MADEIQINSGSPCDKSNTNDQQSPDEGSAWKERYLRLLADLENTKKRLKRTSAQEVESKIEMLLRDILQVADGLDLALMHTSYEEDSRNIVQGIEMNLTLLGKIFSKYGVEEIDALGQPFDPGLHESIGMVRHPGVATSTIVRVEQKGYTIRGKLLRPAKVLIASS